MNENARIKLEIMKNKKLFFDHEKRGFKTSSDNIRGNHKNIVNMRIKYWKYDLCIINNYWIS